MSRLERKAMKIRNRVLLTTGAMALLASVSLGTVAATPINQADVDVQITPIDGATVTVAVAESLSDPFDDKQYSLIQQTSSGRLDVTTTDNRGTATGWTVSISASNFVRTVNTTVGADIPVGNLALSGGTVTKTPGSGNYPSSVTVPASMPAASTQLWKAISNEGDGQFLLPLNGTLTIPAGTLVDKYQSTVTVTVVAAP